MNWDGIEKQTSFPSIHNEVFPQHHDYCPKARRNLREKIQSDIDEFIASGGEIETLPYLANIPESELRKRIASETWLEKNERHRKMNDSGKFKRLGTFDA